MPINWPLVKEIAGGAGVLTAFALGYFKIRQRRMEKKFALEDNPTRCDEHARRLGSLEISCAEYRTDIAHVKGDIKDIKDGVSTLVQMHMKP